MPAVVLGRITVPTRTVMMMVAKANRGKTRKQVSEQCMRRPEALLLLILTLQNAQSVAARAETLLPLPVPTPPSLGTAAAGAADDDAAMKDVVGYPSVVYWWYWYCSQQGH